MYPSKHFLSPPILHKIHINHKKLNPNAHSASLQLLIIIFMAAAETEPLNPGSRLGSNIGSILIDKTLGSAANLTKLLPSGTVLVFQALAPSFTNHGVCHAANKYLTGVLIGICTLTCFLFSFTDSFADADGKMLFGIATFKGLYVFNTRFHENDAEQNVINETSNRELRKYRLRPVDFVHAFFSCLLLVALAMSQPQVQKCFVDGDEANTQEVLKNLPLGIAVLVSIVFLIFPTSRKGIGYSDSTTQTGS